MENNLFNIGEWQEFRFLRKNKSSLIWRIMYNGKTYQTQHGQEDGKMQDHSDTPGSKGLVGSKAFVDEEANCLFHVRREIREKEENGYIKYINGSPVKVLVDKIDFNEFLPKNWCGYKPQTSVTDKALLKAHKAGHARYSRKLDGQCHYAAHHPWGWEIYTRRMDLASKRFPKHIKFLNELDIPVNTLFAGEMLCIDKNGKENFKSISRVCRSSPEEARKIIADGEVEEPTFVVFNAFFFGGKDLSNMTYNGTRKYWENLFPEGDVDTLAKLECLIAMVREYDVTPTTWQDVCKKNGWEGFVFVDGTSVPGDKFYSFNGKPSRPNGHHKLKPTYDADCVIYAANYGSGKRLNKVGAIYVKQKNPHTDEWVELGKCGSGFTDEDIDEVESLCRKNNIPIVYKEKELQNVPLDREDGLLVCAMEYSERQPGTNKFRFPVFMRLRDDKGVDECVAERWREDQPEEEEE